MNLTNDNYYSDFANYEYMSVSQFKDFNGTWGSKGCEVRAVAALRGEVRTEATTAMLIGSYVDAYYEGTLERFKDEHPQIFKKDGELKAEFKKAEQIIERTLKSELFQKAMSGDKQVIMTGELFGTQWKIKMDSYIPGTAITDLKVMQSIRKPFYVRGFGAMDFVRYWGYDIQGAIYQEIVYQNTGERLPFYIAAVSKEDAIDHEVIYVADTYLEQAMEVVRANMPRILAVKSGREAPEGCGACEYCRGTKILKTPIGIADLLKEV